MNVENQPQEKHLVLHAYVRITEELKSKCTNEVKNNTKEHNLRLQQKKTSLPQKIQLSDNFQNILW